jgi:Cu-processing system permease protein
VKRLLALATNTFREAVRDRVLHSILFFAIAGVLFSLALKDVTIGDQEKVVRSVAQGGIDLFASIIAMFLGISLVWKELDKKTIYTILSKPIPRWMFILGKYLGLMITVVVEVFLLTFVYTVLMTFQQSFPPGVFFVSIGMLIVELMLLTAWATLFSAYSAPTTASAFTLAIFVIGHLADDLWLLGSKSDSQMLEEIVKSLYWVLPNFEALSIREEAVHSREIPWERIGYSISYGVTYTIAVLSAAVFVFQRKDIK